LTAYGKLTLIMFGGAMCQTLTLCHMSNFGLSST